MATVQSTNSTNSSSEIFAALNASSKGATTDSTSSTDAVQNRFLKLLVTQLQNQDPLNPLDNAAVTTQIAQINTVTGIEKLNATLQTLLGSYNDTQSMQAAGLIGKSVLAPGSQLALAKGQAGAGVNLTEPADRVTVTILDAAGNTVQSQNLGARDAGSFSFAWDGLTTSGTVAPDGDYKFTVDAVRGGEKVTAEALQVGTVSALVKDNGSFLLEIGGLGRVEFNNVQQIL